MAAVSPQTLLRYCQLVYDAMEAGSKTGDDNTLIWEGRITELFTNQRISNAHYTRVMGTLAELGALEQIRRGARGVSSVYVLHFRPESSTDTALASDSGLTKPTPTDKLDQRVRNLERRLDGIELAKVIANFEKRLSEVESRTRSA